MWAVLCFGGVGVAWDSGGGVEYFRWGEEEAGGISCFCDVEGVIWAAR